jgi:iron complex transport system ATP-binding protein
LRRALLHLSFKKKGTLTMSIISAENINFSYAAKPVMEDVSFAIDEAQIVAIIGPNGSGKTTLLKIINGTLFPDAGQMLIDGKGTSRWSRKDIAQKVAIVPQETAVVFPFYAEEIVLMGRFPHLRLPDSPRSYGKNGYSCFCHPAF